MSKNAPFNWRAKRVSRNTVRRWLRAYRHHLVDKVMEAADALGALPQVSTVAGIGAATGLRLLAVARGWKIPPWPPGNRER